MTKESPMSGYILLAVLTGALGAIHLPINRALGERIQSSLVATLLMLLSGVVLVVRE